MPAGFVSGADKLINAYGKWPDFHDAEVLSIMLDRTRPSLVARVAVYEKHRGSVDERGYYLTDKHCIVTFRFEEIEQLVIQDFNHQNVLSGILFEMDGTLRVTFEGIFGVSARFRCAKAIVDAVVKARVEDLRP